MMLGSPIWGQSAKGQASAGQSVRPLKQTQRAPHCKMHLCLQQQSCNSAGRQPCSSKTGSLYLLGFRVDVCNPRFWVPNTLFEGHFPWFRDPNPRVQTLRVQRTTPSILPGPLAPQPN